MTRNRPRCLHMSMTAHSSPYGIFHLFAPGMRAPIGLMRIYESSNIGLIAQSAPLPSLLPRFRLEILELGLPDDREYMFQ